MSPEGTPVFRALPRLSTSDVADVLQITRARVLRWLSVEVVGELEGLGGAPYVPGRGRGGMGALESAALTG